MEIKVKVPWKLEFNSISQIPIRKLSFKPNTRVPLVKIPLQAWSSEYIMWIKAGKYLVAAPASDWVWYRQGRKVICLDVNRAPVKELAKFLQARALELWKVNLLSEEGYYHVNSFCFAIQQGEPLEDHWWKLSELASVARAQHHADILRVLRRLGYSHAHGGEENGRGSKAKIKVAKKVRQW